MTSGGGGAFLHPTHVLRNAISVRWPEQPAANDSLATQSTGVRPGEGWRAREYDIRLKRNSRAAEGIVEQAVQDVQDAIEPLQREPLNFKRRRAPIKPQAPKCYPDKGRSYLLSFGNIFFPFFNPAFAIGIGLLYWLITWQFQNLVSQYRISSGKIDALGIGTTLASVLQFKPRYFVTAMIAAVSLVAMLRALYATLLWCVVAIERPQIRRYLTKFFVGTTHLLALLVVVFTLSVLAVSVRH